MTAQFVAQTQQLLQRMLHSPDFTREYLAVVEGCPAEDEGWIDLPIGKCDGATIRREVRADGREARTHYRVMKRGARSLIRRRLDTGRTHQIRVHMASIGHPVLGDPVYGPKKSPYPVEGGQLLHAFRLGFVHPRTGEEMLFEAEPEARFTWWLEKLKK